MMFKRGEYVSHMAGNSWVFDSRKKRVAYRVDDGSMIAYLVHQVCLVKVLAFSGSEVGHDGLVLSDTCCGARRFNGIDMVHMQEFFEHFNDATMIF